MNLIKVWWFTPSNNPLNNLIYESDKSVVGLTPLRNPLNNLIYESDKSVVVYPFT